MQIDNGLGWTFDTVAAAYDKYRPTYPEELYGEIFNYISLDDRSRTVEVGIGTGQATLPILKTGCSVTAVEPGMEFSAICREKFKEYNNFSVIAGKFEGISFEPNEYDFLYSATAFHWIPESVGYPKVFAMLKPGGAFARFANHPCPAKDDQHLFDEIQDIYAEFFPKKRAKAHDFTDKQAENLAKIAEKYSFVDIKFSVFHRTRTFSASEYCALLGTYSDHIVIEETLRKLFLSKIEAAINSHGGSITVFDTVDLQLARKPSAL